MSVEQVRNKAINTIREIGRAGLHAIAPDDFEYYACTFELIDSQGRIEDIFHFPVMPTEISVGRQSLVSIQKTGKAYMSQFNDSFVGRNINLGGTFGRRFRLLVSRGIGSNITDADNPASGYLDLNVKTGYGAVKLLEKIIESSQKLDSYGNPKLLVFYNSTLNHNHLVEVLDFNLNQSMESNMMWNWNIQIKALADIDGLIYNGDLRKHLNQLLAMSAINKSIGNIFKNVSFEGLSNVLTNSNG